MSQVVHEPAMQKKSAVSSPSDKYEQEADRVADKVASQQPAPKIARLGSGGLRDLTWRDVSLHARVQKKIFDTEKESNVPNFRPHVPSPLYYQRFAALQGLRKFQTREGDHERNRLITLYETRAAQDPGSYTGNVYKEILPSSTARSNIVAAAENTFIDPVSNRTRWALQVSLLAYLLEYGQPEFNSSFLYEWHDFAFRFSGDSPTIGKIPWFVLRYIDIPGTLEFYGGKAGRQLGSELVGYAIYVLNQPDGSIPTWALPLRMALDALGSFPEVFHGEMLRPVFFPEAIQKKAFGDPIKWSKWSTAQSGRLEQNLNYTVSQVLNSPQGGSPIIPSTRMALETSMAVDLSTVRVHDDAAAHELSSALNARAFTHRNNIWLGAGESQYDLWLMAHEATHVVQQEGSTLNRLQCKRDVAKASAIYLDNPDEVAKFEKDFATRISVLTVKGKQIEIKDGTKLGEIKFITQAGGNIFFKWNNTIRVLKKSKFEHALIVGQFGKSLYESTRAIIPIAKYEALLVMVVFRPDLLLDVAGNIIQGRSPIDEDAMREYLAGELFRPLGRETGSKLTDILLGDILKPASEEAFKQLARNGKLEPGKYTEDVLVSVFSAQVGKRIAALPADSKLLLQTTNDALRESLGGLISKEIGTGVSVVKELSVEN